MEKENYKDPIYGDIEITLIKREVETTDDAKRTDEIYELPSGDFRVKSTLEWLKVKTAPFIQEFFFKKSWIRSIIEEKTKNK